MKLLNKTPDDYYDWAILDPEYGIKAARPSRKSAAVKQNNGSTLNVKQKIYKHKNWDDKPAGSDFFKEVFRVSKNQIIWGVNYFDYDMRGGRIVWDKMNGESDQHGCEIAFNSSNNRTDIIRYMWSGMMQGVNVSKCNKKDAIQQGNKKLNEKRIHPCQKPVKLYEWMLIEYVEKGSLILDTGFGSGNLGKACFNQGLKLVACENDLEIYNDGIKNVDWHCRQKRLF
jgi:site-specific DNA-methyltransferase (adenine-specific)